MYLLNCIVVSASVPYFGTSVVSEKIFTNLVVAFICLIIKSIPSYVSVLCTALPNYTYHQSTYFIYTIYFSIFTKARICVSHVFQLNFSAGDRLVEQEEEGKHTSTNFIQPVTTHPFLFSFLRNITLGDAVLEGSEAIFSENKFMNGNGQAFAQLCNVAKVTWHSNIILMADDMPLTLQVRKGRVKEVWGKGRNGRGGRGKK